MKSQGKFHIPQNICEASQQTSFKLEKKKTEKIKKKQVVWTRVSVVPTLNTDLWL